MKRAWQLLYHLGGYGGSSEHLFQVVVRTASFQKISEGISNNMEACMKVNIGIGTSSTIQSEPKVLL